MTPEMKFCKIFIPEYRHWPLSRSVFFWLTFDYTGFVCSFVYVLSCSNVMVKPEAIPAHIVPFDNSRPSHDCHVSDGE